ncbi:MAG TPA: hypothetical protein PKA33_16550 [Amaricoccus sp.]|uniref:hypothetical protein n=1 Tax=Amaricoccus sp. TaxID=1872485 RepID=UPI002B7BEA99|nr:hypothetical protein [Amaricoccus sp.]HMQ94080.1 hypothetical protein [Amaricoccus sp.]HMR53960.1 hypothetical protein [Amaricoccus sp.]HMR61475.1 hypothetical protein [Amaricoccus sp.]HMU00956.1 hypothetical protein [Amaricoccus sp.]
MTRIEEIEAEPGAIRPEAGTADSVARRRAARYLDLWERHLALCALHGPAPAPRPGRTGA